MLECRVFLVLAGLKLLAFVAVDGRAFGADLEFEVVLFDLDLPQPGLGGIQTRRTVRELLLPCLALRRDLSQLGFESPDSLVPVLQRQKARDFVCHRSHHEQTALRVQLGFLTGERKSAVGAPAMLGEGGFSLAMEIWRSADFDCKLRSDGALLAGINLYETHDLDSSGCCRPCRTGGL